MVDRPVAAAGTEAGSVEVVGVVVGVAMAATRAVEESLEVRAAREEVTAAGSEAVSAAGLEAWSEERSAGVGTAAAAAARTAAKATWAAAWVALADGRIPAQHAA